MIDFITSHISEAAFALLWAALVAYISGVYIRYRALSAGVQNLLRAEIIRSYEKYTERGFCPIYAKEALTMAYKSYHDLGGNDVATSLYNQIMALPTEGTKND